MAIEKLIQGISAVLMLFAGTYLIAFTPKEIKPFANKFIKASGAIFIALGISIVLLMVTVQQAAAWQIGKTAVVGVASILCFVSGVYNLVDGQGKYRTVSGILSLILAVLMVLLFILYLSYGG
jgi:hypothetical protein